MTSKPAGPPSLAEILEEVNTLTDWGERPATTASDRGASDDYPLHKVAIWGEVEAAQVLLDHGADVNARGEDNDTPLHRAVAGKHPQMVRFLLSHGADPTLRNRYGNSAQDEASDPELVEAFRR